MRQLLVSFCISVLFSSIARGAAAQYEGGIRGVVRDESGGVILGVPVTLTNENTNIARTIATNEVGEYNFVSVTPATYTIEIALDNYQPIRESGIEIDVQRFIVLDIELELASVTERVEVTGVSPVLDTGNASNATSLRKAELENLPTLGRNPYILTTTTPTVQANGAPAVQSSLDQTNTSRLSLAGGPVRSNNYTMDGVPVVDMRNRAVIIPSLESIEEVKVQVSTYDAELGRTGGGVFNTVHRRGGNRVHGSALFQTRPKWGQARDFFTKRADEELPDELAHRLYAGSFGGPILRDRTFFWASTEGFRSNQSTSGRMIFPTGLEARGDFSQSGFTVYDPLTTREDPDSPSGFIRDPFPGNVIPQDRMNRVGRNIAAVLASGGTGPTDLTRLVELSADQFSVNVTHQFDPNNSLSGTYMFFDSEEVVPGALQNESDTGVLERRNHVLALNHTLIGSDSSVYQFRYGFTQFGQQYVPERFDPAALGFSENFLSQTTDVFPDIAMLPYPFLGPGNPSERRWYSHAVNGTATKLIGNHTIKFGGAYRRLGVDALSPRNVAGFDFDRGFTSGPDPFSPDRNSGDPLASLFLGFPADGDIGIAVPNNFFFNYFAGFVQNDWRATDELVLNLGLRIEHESGLAEENNAFTVGFDRETPWPVQPIDGMTLRGGLLYAGVDGNQTTQGDPSAVKLGPRAGAAYSLNDETLVKGGYGLFWAPIQHRGPSENQFGTRGFTATTSYIASNDFGLTPAGSLTDPFPVGLEQPRGSSLGVLTGAGTNVSFVDQFSRSAYVHQFTLGVEREVANDISLSATYVGSRGRRLSVGGSRQDSLNINQVDPSFQSLGPALLEPVPNPFFGNPIFGNLSGSETVPRAQLLRPYPQYLNLQARQVSDGRSRYDGVVFKLQKRFRRGWSANVNYTWSRLEDNVFGEGTFFNGSLHGAIDATDLEREYGPSDFDVPHRLNVSGIVELPFGQGKRWLDGNGLVDALVGGWSIAVTGIIQSGVPIKIIQIPNNTGLFTDIQRPNRVPGVDPVLDPDPNDGLLYLNPDAWEFAAPFTFGETPRNDTNVRGRGRNNWDMAFQKTVPLGPTQTTVRFEWLNIFNRPEFHGPVPAVGVPVFGLLDGTGGSFARTLQFMVRVAW